MKIIAFNGSPNINGNTYHALNVVCNELNKEGIETEIINIGNKNISGCRACYSCARNQDGKCAINPEINEYIEKLKTCDGIIISSPVHYSGIAGNMKSFLDCLFFVNSKSGNFLRHKVGCSVVSVRRSGGVATFDQLNNYLMYSEMFIATSNYWNVIHGSIKGHELDDLEGVNMLEVLGENMAYLLKATNNSNIEAPSRKEKVMTNFVRPNTN